MKNETTVILSQLDQYQTKLSLFIATQQHRKQKADEAIKSSGVNMKSLKYEYGLIELNQQKKELTSKEQRDFLNIMSRSRGYGDADAQKRADALSNYCKIQSINNIILPQAKSTSLSVKSVISRLENIQQNLTLFPGLLKNPGIQETFSRLEQLLQKMPDPSEINENHKTLTNLESTLLAMENHIEKASLPAVTALSDQTIQDTIATFKSNLEWLQKKLKSTHTPLNAPTSDDPLYATWMCKKHINHMLENIVQINQELINSPKAKDMQEMLTGMASLNLNFDQSLQQIKHIRTLSERIAEIYRSICKGMGWEDKYAPKHQLESAVNHVNLAREKLRALFNQKIDPTSTPPEKPGENNIFKLK